MPVSKVKLEVARKLAQSHLDVDRDVQGVYLLEADKDTESTPLCLLEVVEGTLERGVEPVFFRPDPARGIPYPFVIVELSPRERLLHGNGKIEIKGEDFSIGRQLASR